MSRHTFSTTLLAAFAIGGIGTLQPVGADELIQIMRHHSAQSVLSGNALSGVKGIVNVNMAAGDGNLQNNAGVIALGDYAAASNGISQITKHNNDLALDKASVRIQDRAFNNAVGWISVNQAAGLSNVQSNTMSVALGIEGSSLSDSGLGQVLSGKQELSGNQDNHDATQRQLEIESTTFSGARGLIQVNQSAGTGNDTHNKFSLQMTGVGG